MTQPPITGTTHTLPFDKLSPRDFERLCLWLVEREGYEHAEHLGAAGSEQGRDIIAWREGKLWAFQCKRVQQFGPKHALAEVEKVLVLPQGQRPAEYVFLVACDVSTNTRQQVRERCAGEMRCHFWTGTELDEKVKRHPDVLEEFFQLDQGSTIQKVTERVRRFQTLINEQTRGFVGRDFIFRAIDDLLENSGFPSGYIVISGEPGIGKTALIAQLVKQRGYIHHFNIAAQNIRSTRVFLENTCAQLIVRYGLKHKELPPGAADDSGFLIQCLEKVAANRKDHPIVLAIDALDEADRLDLSPAINSLYLPHSLPEGVYIIVTTRHLLDMRLHVAQQRMLNLEADSESNLRDIGVYIETYAQREAMHARLSAWRISTDQFVAALQRKSQGNFMYLHYVLPAIEEGKFVKGTLDELPEGLMAYYQRHWRQMREGNEREFDTVYAPIVCILAVAREPVTVEHVAAWAKLSQRQVKRAIELWREFLEEELVDSERRYRIYHASFQDFLREQVE